MRMHAIKTAIRRSWPAFVIGISIVALSFSTYQSDPGHSPEWQVHHFDSGDYRYIAEYFWGKEHDLRTYSIEFANEWGTYLRIMPFREIGVGTVYLLFHMLKLSADGMRNALFFGTAFAGLFAYWSAYKKYNVYVATACIIALFFPAKMWGMHEELLSEPLLRICFLVLWGILVWIGSSSDRLRSGLLALLLLVLLVTHIKSSWLLLALWLATVVLLAHWKTLSKRNMLLTIVLCAAPLSLLVTHGIGWGHWGLTAGTGLHMNHKTGGFFAWNFCSTHEDYSFCGNRESADPYWFLSTKGTQQEWQDLDSAVLRHITQHPKEAATDVLRALQQQSNTPSGISGNTEHTRNWVQAFFDAALWLFLIIGLRRKETFRISSFVLALWMINALGAAFSLYTTRYGRPMMGLPLATAFIILWHEIRNRPAWKARLLSLQK